MGLAKRGKNGCRGAKWNEDGKGGERHFLWEDAARGVIRED